MQGQNAYKETNKGEFSLGQSLHAPSFEIGRTGATVQTTAIPLAPLPELNVRRLLPGYLKPLP
jgi:hypothetical protein